MECTHDLVTDDHYLKNSQSDEGDVTKHSPFTEEARALTRISG
jgi:hypothetical protein